MNRNKKRTSFLCPNCRKLISRSAPVCPNCDLKNPDSIWKDNIITRATHEKEGILKVILVANITMFVLSIIIDPRSISLSSSPFNFLSPSNNSLLVLGSTGTIPLLHLHRWWTLISANFLHGSLLHIVFNMIALYQLGPLIMREYGPNRMIVIYTFSGVGGYIISTLFGIRFTIGASAAVCGLIGAALYYGKSRGGTYGDAVYRQISGWAIGIFIFGFLVPGINNWGHFGGMFVGVMTAYFLGYQEKYQEKSVHKFLGKACLVSTGMVLFWSIVNGVFFLFR